MEIDVAFNLISRAIDSQHAANGYLIVGDVRGNAEDLALKILNKLFPNDAAQIASWSHPDVIMLEPQGKARIISVNQMRDDLITPMSTTAFSGGWKVGIIRGADRLRAESANAFLKSLEEPTPKTMYLLLTDQPDAILPTIISRSQRVDLPLPPDLLDDETMEEVGTLYAERDAIALATKFNKLLDEADDEDAALVRKTFFRTLMHFARKMMLSGKLPRHLAFRNLEAIEAAYRRNEQAYISAEAALSYMLDQTSFPQ